MTIEISRQLTSFLASGLLGAMLGLLYDLLRALRPAGSRGLSLLDGLYCLAAFAAVFYFTMTVGDGELRLYNRCPERKETVFVSTSPVVNGTRTVMGNMFPCIKWDNSPVCLPELL